MGLIERIKQLFKKDKTKLLPEPQYTQEPSQHDNSWIISNASSNYQPQLTKLDLDITNFLTKYSQSVSQINSYDQINNYKTAYACLCHSGEQITQEQYNYNGAIESNLLSNIESGNQYKATPEGGFYHIQSQNYQMPDFADMARVYINCNSTNISDLAQTILNSNTNPNFYMKFISNDSNTQGPRNEKMVIYCNKNELDYTMNLLNYCKQIRPELFTGSQSLPFLKSEQGLASIGYQPTTNQYMNLQGQTKQIPQSVNAFITNMLQESYMNAAREIARVDSNLSFLFDENNYNNETLYMQNYPYISENYQEYLLSSMKAKLEVLSRYNNIEIDGIPRQNQHSMDNDRQVSQENYYDNR